MTFTQPRHTFLSIATLAFFLSHSIVLKAENPSSSQSASGSSSNDLTPPPTVTPPSQPAQQQDRANSNDAAKALAMAGAAMSMIGCAAMLKQAAETEDPQQKALLQMMGMQQCSQGLQNAADAAKNDDNKKQLTQNDSPKQSQLTAQPFKTPTDKPQDPTVASTQPTTTSGGGANDNNNFDNGFKIPVDLPSDTKKDATAKQDIPSGIEEPVNVTNQPTGDSKGPQGSGTTTPPAIDNGKLGFDEGAKGTAIAAGQGPTGGQYGFGGSTYGGNSSNPASDLVNKLSESDSSQRAKRGGASSGGDAGAGAEGGAGGGTGKEPSADPFSGIMGNLFGQNGAAGEAGAMATGNQMVSMPTDATTGKPKTNIFQFAHLWYRHLAFNQGRLKIRAPGSRGLASSEGAIVIKGGLGN